MVFFRRIWDRNHSVGRVFFNLVICAYLIDSIIFISNFGQSNAKRLIGFNTGCIRTTSVPIVLPFTTLVNRHCLS